MIVSNIDHLGQSRDFTIQGLPRTGGHYNQTGNLTTEYAEGRGGEING